MIVCGCGRDYLSVPLGDECICPRVRPAVEVVPAPPLSRLEAQVLASCEAGETYEGIAAALSVPKRAVTEAFWRARRKRDRLEDLAVAA